ncbi:MAG: hypothetical protein KC609_07365, partial [Myxococcales bacterium]|nr:hypothetical protein [Myxococcales bacterium]
PAQLETLRLLLRHPDVRRRFTIVMLHHHVTQTPIDDSQNGVVRRLYDRIERSFMDKLDNAREVKELLTRSRVDLILHGHQHHTYKTFMGNIRVFCSGSSIYPGTDGDIRPFYEIYTLQDLHLSVESWYHDGQTFVSACPV